LIIRSVTQGKSGMLKSLAALTGRVKEPEFALQGIAAIKTQGVRFKAYGAGPLFISLLTNIKTQRAALNDDLSVKAAADAIQQINDAK
jgi:aminopeptidase N